METERPPKQVLEGGLSFSQVDQVFSLPVAPQAIEESIEELNEDVATEHRFDTVPIKLERRGVTSHPKENGESHFEKEVLWKESLVLNLDNAARGDIADAIRSCHTEANIRQCTSCRAFTKFWNRCEVKWCPICAPRLARERRESVEWWTRQVKQPKHVVLTSRNSEIITKGTVQRFKKAFAKLRRTKFASNWKGGFYSLEITNEGRGWHLHLHALIDARWIDCGNLAIEWAKAIGQDFAIVKVRDTREVGYLQEVLKYAVKGSDLASWNDLDQIAFIEAFDGVRTFGVFGSLYAKRTEWREFLKELRNGRIKCQCGACNWRVLTEQEFEWEQCERDLKEPRPPPIRKEIPINQLEFRRLIPKKFPH